MVKIALASDIHNEFHSTSPTLEVVDADVLVLAGDIETVKSHSDAWWDETCSHYEHVIYIRGNHEYYKTYYRDFPNLYYPDNVIVGRVPATIFDLFGHKWLIGTMWTDLSRLSDASLAKGSMNDYRLIKYSRERHYFTPADTTREFFSFKQSLMDLKPDIVVSHHLPSYGSVDSQYKDDRLSSAYATELDIEGVTLWMHGHTHNTQDYVKQGCRVVANPKGYPTECVENYKPKVIEL